MANTTVGDIFQVRTDKGLAYLQVALHNKLFGEFVRVLPGIFDAQLTDLGELAAKKEVFSTFFPASYAYRKGMLKKVGRADVPVVSRELPMMRMGETRDKSGTLVDWTLFDGEQQLPAKRTKEERDLPLVSVPSFDVLQDLITGARKLEDV